MNKTTKHEIAFRRRQNASPRSRVVPFIMACMATLLALPVNAAVVWPDNPLQSGASVPPNIMFILDNSGSMALVSMPFDVEDPEYTGTSTGASQSGLKDNPHDRSYLNNTVYYNPNVTYQPWMTADAKTRLTGGTDVTKVFKDWNLADTGRGTRDLRDNSESIFYVPKSGVTSSTDPKDFDKYWIRNNGGTAQVVYAGTTVLQTWSWTQDVGEGGWKYQTITVPAGTDQLVIDIAGNTNGSGRGNAELYVKRTADPTTGSYDYRDTGSGSTETVTIASPASGTWHIGVYNVDSGSGDRTVYGNKLTISANSSIKVGTPTGRSQADELKNIATWYSYARTRIKTAKSGASEAFASLGRGYRVGYTPINGRSADLSSKGTGPIIPVDKDDGRFEDDATTTPKVTNRTDWYKVLQSEVVQSGSTPLRTTLDAVGQYYTRKDKNGPWADGTDAEQLACRPSFSILTTDGYWNDSTSSKFGLGDEDKDSRSVTLADIAMHYYKTDLRTDLSNDVPPSTADPADWQHMVTFSLSIGLQGTAALAKKYPDPKNPPASNSSDWPNPMDAEDLDRVDDLWHAAVNGHGTFVAASNPTEFAKGLVDALAAVAGRAGSASNVSTNSQSFQTNSAVYQASYIPGSWTGEVQAFRATSGGVQASPLWSVSKLIPAFGSRKIVTWDGTKGVTFPTTAQKTALARASGVAPVSGDDNANYIMGDPSLEKRKGKTLRDRSDTVLGDIVNSSPAYSNDNNTLFVGANDGMLHAFNGTADGTGGGNELFAYIPAGLNFSGTTGLGALSDPQYVHSWFVDGPVVVSTKTQTPGKNYLIGALGRGGKGLYGLDVTSPSTFSASNVLWDKTGSAAPADMGQVLGEPLVVKMNDGTTAIIAGNGVNSSTGTAALYIIKLDDGTVIKEFDTGATGGNGLAAPRGWDNDGNGTVDYGYAGDMKGNLWKFDLTASTNSSWKIANGGKAMFVATDAGNKLQPITAGLGLARDPSTGKRWVFIGTGKFLETSDVLDMNVQSMYGVIDDDSVVKGRTSGGDGDLQKRTIIEIDATQKYRGFEAHGTLDPSKKGWYIDLLTPPTPTAEGERITNRPIVSGTVLITASMIPPTDEDSCDAGGRGYLNALDAFTGTSTNEPYFDANGDGDFTNDTIGDPAVPIGSVDLGVGMPTLPTLIENLLVVGGSKATMGQIKVNPQGANPRRISWREILRD
jgi:type IV pilus assembly protein PilY1